MKTVNQIIFNRLKATCSERVARLFLEACNSYALPELIMGIWQLELRDSDPCPDSINKNSASTDMILGLQDARFSEKTTKTEKAFCKLLFENFNALKKSESVKKTLLECDEIEIVLPECLENHAD